MAARIHGFVSRIRAAGAGETGQAAVLSVVWMVVLLGLAGLVIDVGSWYRSQRNLQSQADASALAGAQDLPKDVTGAGGLAQTYAQKNGFALPASGITISGDAVPNDSITVKVDKPAPTFFSRLFGITTVPTRAEATARASTLGQAQYVAPIVVNIKHPMLSGQLNGQPCPCFNTPTSLPLGKAGAPGSFDLIDLVNTSGNGNKTLADWILNGYTGYLGLGPYSSNTGAKFSSQNIQSALNARIGTVLLFPVYDTLTFQGTNAIYHVIAWVGFRLTGYTVQGNTGSISGNFTTITWQGIPSASGSGEPDLGAYVITLVH